MPGSIRENNADLRQFVIDHNIRAVLDVGPGRGTYAHVLAGLECTMDAVEIWRPYIRRYDLRRIYREVYWQDVRDVRVGDSCGFEKYDLILFGDVLEHMSRVDSLAVWDRARRSAKYVMMSVPIIHYPQEASHGNPYEKHVQEHLLPEIVRDDYGPFVADWCYATTGTFIAAGNGPAVSGNGDGSHVCDGGCRR